MHATGKIAVLDRRTLLMAAAATALTDRVSAQEPPNRVQLWPGEPPGGGGPIGLVRVSAQGAVTNVSSPFLEIATPSPPNGAAVLVAGGGGYTYIDTANEAHPAAKWLTEQGVTAFVLIYRLPREGWHNGPLAPLQDAQRAMRVMRSLADTYHLDPKRMGALGFSAGGHLAGMTAVRADFHSYLASDRIDEFSARPDFAALIYPVVTLGPPLDHTSTCHELIGDHPSPAARDEWSVQTHVHRGCPPMFLVDAEDDPICKPAHTGILEAACLSADVAVERHQFKIGGHGFGMGRPDTPEMMWPDMYRAWLSWIGILT
ncbi:alpha/beta hydrolase [Methylobacterium durans]|uniref:alpha/beta hydrolase n=1 Tax=Methylobacterium durans TaxID=2202825 RepID=UPI001F305FF3|nr:alpha/beta hydrolase [Methylobacterium durans]